MAFVKDVFPRCLFIQIYTFPLQISMISVELELMQCHSKIEPLFFLVNLFYLSLSLSFIQFPSFSIHRHFISCVYMLLCTYDARSHPHRRAHASDEESKASDKVIRVISAPIQVRAMQTATSVALSTDWGDTAAAPSSPLTPPLNALCCSALTLTHSSHFSRGDSLAGRGARERTDKI